MRAVQTVGFTMLIMGVASSLVWGITIDGQFGDWTDAVEFAMPAEVTAQVGSLYAVVNTLGVTHDKSYLYFRLKFKKARPFSDGTQSDWQDNFWSNMRYIILDVNGDAKPDYYTNQISRPGVGVNRTYVVKYTDEGPSTYLWYEGHPKWRGGPQGHYSPDGKQLEMRVPIAPLHLEGPTIGIQVQMSLRDGIEGTNQWTNDHYPSSHNFFWYSLASAARIDPSEGSRAVSVTMVPTQMPPVIDGNIDDSAWHGKPVLTDFVRNRGDEPAPVQTEVHITYDSDNLYLAIYAHEPDMENLKTEAIEAESKRVWGDDCIELFIDYHNDEQSFFHLGVTAAGKLAAQLGVAKGGSSRAATDVEPVAETAYEYHERGWSIEIALPFANMGVSPVAGEVWGLNICRGRPGANEYSSWAGVQGRFAQPAEFGDAIFPSASSLRVASRGLVARQGNSRQANAVSGSYTAANNAELRVAAVVRKDQKEIFGDSEIWQAPAGQRIEFLLPYIVTGDNQVVTFRIWADEELLYENDLPAIETEFARVWQTDDPLYAELMGDAGPGMAAHGVLYWGHDLVNYRLGPVCLKYAPPYVLEESYRNAARRKLRYLDGGSYIGADNFEARHYSKKHGVQFVFRGSLRSGAEGKPRDKGNFTYVIDYENQEVYLDGLEQYVTRWPDYIWGVMTGDEFHEKDMPRGLRFHYDDDPYPFMRQVDKEVKEEFGYDKWGIPTSLADKNPFRWIAYRRWYNDRFARFQKRIYQTVKAIDPEVYVIGPDPVAQI